MRATVEAVSILRHRRVRFLQLIMMNLASRTGNDLYINPTDCRLEVWT